MDHGRDRRGTAAHCKSGWARFLGPATAGALALALSGGAVALASSSPVESGTYKGTTSQRAAVKLQVFTTGTKTCKGLCVVIPTNNTGGIYLTLKCSGRAASASVPFQTYGAKIKSNGTVSIRHTVKHPTDTLPDWTVAMTFTGHGTVTGKLTAKGSYDGGGSPQSPCSGHETFSARLRGRG
jgi:hypothetical protein